MAFSIIHGLWMAAAVIFIAAVFLGWFGKKYANWRPGPERK